MISINLLPHREQARKNRRQQFYSMIGLVVIVAAAIWFVVYQLIDGAIQKQESSNNYLKTEIATLDKDIAEIKRMKEQMQALLSRKKVIEELQSNRTETVTLFNELAKQMPEGVQLRGIKQTGMNVNFTGYSQSNARVSQLMRNLDASPILENPTLDVIKTTTYNKRTVGDFSLNMSIERAPVAEQSGAVKAPSSQQSAGVASK